MLPGAPAEDHPKAFCQGVPLPTDRKSACARNRTIRRLPEVLYDRSQRTRTGIPHRPGDPRFLSDE